VSSLYRAAQSAKNLKDEEMKFKWDFNQISNEEYLDYVTNRAKEQTDQSDIIKWARAINTVKKEIRADMRAKDFLNISMMPENNSKKAYAKYAAYVKLANAAAKDGDNDAFIAAQTAANNAWTAYKNKLGSEARAGSASAVKTLTKKNQAELDAIATEEMDIKREFADDPLKMAALLGNLYMRKSKVNADMANALANYEDKDNQIRDKARQAQKDWDKAVLFAEKVGIESYDYDENGNIVGFTPKVIVGPDGSERLVAGDGYAKIITPSGTKLIKNGVQYSFREDSNGSVSVIEEKAPENNNLAEIIDPDTGEKYYSEIQYTRQEPTINTKTGLYRSPMEPTASLSQKQLDKKIKEGGFRDTRFIIDQQGHKRAWNPATNRFDLYVNRGDLEDYAQNIEQRNADKYNNLAKINAIPNTNINTYEYRAMLPQLRPKLTGSFVDKSGQSWPGAEFEKPLIGGTPYRLPEVTGTLARNLYTPGSEAFHNAFFGNILTDKAEAINDAKSVMSKSQLEAFNAVEANKKPYPSKELPQTTVAKQILSKTPLSKTPNVLKPIATKALESSVNRKYKFDAAKENIAKITSGKKRWNPINQFRAGWEAIKGIFL
jgi:hypothetical protein